MRALVTNPPWPGPGYGARSDVRWLHKSCGKIMDKGAFRNSKITGQTREA